MSNSLSLSRRRSLQTLAASALFALGAAPSMAQTPYPSKPITMIVPFSAGGTTDILARVVGQALSTELGQSIIIDNRPGAGGNIGGQAAARAAGDGYTLFMGTVGTHAINEALYKKMPFDPVKDFAPLTRVANVPNLLVAHPSQPFKTVKEMMAYAKANPGKLNFGSSGSGSSIHLSGELFKSMTHLDMVHVPYKGSAPAITDLLGGQVDFSFQNVNAVLPHLRSGKLRAIAVTGSQRSPVLPDVPTLAESGVKGAEVYSWQGMAAPRGLPADVKSRLAKAAIVAVQQPDIRKRFVEQGLEIVGNTPEEFTRFQAQENERWKTLIQTRKITAD